MLVVDGLRPSQLARSWPMRAGLILRDLISSGKGHEFITVFAIGTNVHNRTPPSPRSSHFPDGNLDQRCGPKQNGVRRLSAAMLSNSIEQSRSNAMRDWTLIEIQPQPETVCISQGRTVVITGLDGFVSQDSHQGLWIYQSRALSKYRWTIDDRPPQLSAFSAVHENSSIAYYISAPTNWKKTGAKTPDPAQQAIELRVTRRPGNGMQEDVFVIN